MQQFDFLETGSYGFLEPHNIHAQRRFPGRTRNGSLDEDRISLTAPESP